MTNTSLEEENELKKKKEGIKRIFKGIFQLLPYLGV
jgi:hypothetical protein